MGNAVLFPGFSTRKSIDAILFDIAEHALQQNGVPYAREAKQLSEATLVVNDEKYVGAQDILGYAFQNGTKTPSKGLSCRRTQLYMTEFVRKEKSVSDEERAGMKNHLMTGCEKCFQHLETECVTYDTQKAMRSRQN